MLNNLTNFFNLIRGRKIKTTPDGSDLIPLGTRDPRFDGSYQPTAITVDDFVASLPPDINIYNSDGTLTGNRTVDLDGNTINFNDGKVGINTTNIGGVNLHVSGNGAIFRLEGTNHVYQEFYPQGSTTRFGYLGYGSSGSSDLRLFNESSTGRLEFGTSVLPRMVISASGNVGIGTTTPTANLHINNTTTGNTFLVEDSTNPDSTPFVIDASGNTIIGATTATTGIKLDINGGIRTRVTDGIVLLAGGETAVSGLPTGADGIRVRYENDLFATNEDGLIFEKTDNNQPIPDGGIMFANLGNNGIRVPAMSIRGTGNVGIGTTTPTAALEVNGPAFPGIESVAKFTVADDAASSLQIKNGTSAAATFVPEILGTNSTNRPALGISGVATTDTGTEAVTIFQSLLASATAVVTRPIFQWKNFSTNVMTILADGKVGIGTATPGETLDVNGKTKTTTFQLTTTPTAGYVLTSDASGNGSWAAGGLTYFTEAQSTAAPNATVPVDSLTAVSATTNADIAIVPKGTGAFTLQVADNTAAGGNKRGANAIDLSTKRAVSTDVASGASSIVIGERARATNTNSFAVGLGGLGAVSSGGSSVAIGAWTTATGNISFAVGNRVDATGLHSVSIGGYQYGATTASGESSFASGGATASGDYSLAIGPGNIANGRHSVATGTNAHTFGISGRRSHSAGSEATQGDSQASKFILRERTTGNTATTITTDSGAAGTANQVILSNQSAYRFKGSIVGKQSGSVNAAVWDIDGFIVRGANAAATTLNVSNVTLVENTPAWGTPTLAADTTNGGLRVQVTGAAATNIQWTAVIDTTEVIYA